MIKTAETVLADVLRLDSKGRAEVARELLASLDGLADTDAASAWADEIRRRVAALESGSAELESWDDAVGRIERDILGR
ncbi:MAG: addiction module protein [Spirochaetaceae bacterium]|nr:addiction module protein [Spirochaetaceae bacterium]